MAEPEEKQAPQKIDRKLMELPEPIRALGLSEVKIRLYADVTAVLRVEVVKQT